MKKLFVNCFIFSFPLLVCAGFFVFDDPFGILFKENCLVECSEDVVKTRAYFNAADPEKYTAFMFGNSRVHSFAQKDWKKHIGDQNVFVFCAPGESVLNIKKKLELVLERQEIKYAFILIDVGILENTDNEHRSYKGPVYNHTPLTSNVSNFEFYANYVRYYFDDLFFLKHMIYRTTGIYRRSWMNSAFQEKSVVITPFKSHRYQTLADSLIETNYRSYVSVFNPNYTVLKRTLKNISKKDSAYLVEIRKLLEDHHVDYKVLTPPDFLGEDLNPGIRATLTKILGKNYYDLSGFRRVKNDSTLNYENLHFTIKAGSMMLDSIYAGS